MDLTSAAAFASRLSFVVFALAAVWYVAPWLAALRRADALALLLWIHAFRHVALQIFSAQRFGFAVSDTTRDQIAAGDVIGMILAVVTIIALRHRLRLAIVLAWAFVLETAADLISSTIPGIREQLSAMSSGVRWISPTLYVRLWWVSLGGVAWQPYSRRGETLGPAPAKPASAGKARTSGLGTAAEPPRPHPRPRPQA